jgi:hypothetical protein
MSRYNQIGRIATTTTEGITRVTYYKTVVVAFDAKSITLNTGGWFTATTKTRMNQASNQFDLGFNVCQKSRQWFATYRGQTIAFNGDSITIER